jgi:hypothetical protein
MPDLEVTGILYPPKEEARAGTEGIRTRAQRRFEFLDNEIKEMIAVLPGLPLCLSHDLHKVIGKVVSAELTLTDGVYVTVRIDTSTELGAESAAKVQSRYYRGLSLGHAFEQDARTGHTVKTPLEVTLCVKPRRPGCALMFLRGTAGGGYEPEEIDSSINTTGELKVDEKLFGTIECDIDFVKMESDSAPPATHAEPQPEVPPTEAPQPMAVDTPTEPAEPPAEQPPCELDIQQILRTVRESHAAIAQQKDEHAAMELRLKEANDRASKMEAEMQAEKRAAAEAIELQKKELAELNKRERKREAEMLENAKREVYDLSNNLRSTLDSREKLKAISPEASETEKQALVAEILKQSIKDADDLRKQAANMQRHTQKLEHQNTEINTALSHFGQPVVVRGLMKASRDEEGDDQRQPDKRTCTPSLFRTYRQNVGMMSMPQLQRLAMQYEDEQAAASGVYNASADDLNMQIDSGQRKLPAISMEELYPELYSKISKDYTGLYMEPSEIVELSKQMYYTDNSGRYNRDFWDYAAKHNK